VRQIISLDEMEKDRGEIAGIEKGNTVKKREKVCGLHRFTSLKSTELYSI